MPGEKDVVADVSHWTYLNSRKLATTLSNSGSLLQQRLRLRIKKHYKYTEQISNFINFSALMLK